MSTTDDGALPHTAAADTALSASMRLKVFCRIRPAKPGELQAGDRSSASTSSAVEVSKPIVGHKDPTVVRVAGKDFEFDRIFDALETNSDVFDCCCMPIVDHVVSGFNGAIMCYGQTGTGKTFTMSNDLRNAQKTASVPIGESGENEGVLFKSVRYLFGKIASTTNSSGVKRHFTVRCSFIQIYRDNLQDLLDPATPFLTLRRDQETDDDVIDATLSPPLTSFEQFLTYFVNGDRHRVVAETQMNKSSSRGHSLLSLLVKQRSPGTDGLDVTSPNYVAPFEATGRLVFVDLAGYERLTKTMIVDNVRKDEAKHINLSLSSLANVIHSMTNDAKHIPWRNSKLTRVLKPTLAGNSITSIMLTIGPSRAHLTETVNTLHFGHHAIQCKTTGVRVNLADIDYKVEHSKLLIAVERLKAENADLRYQLKDAQGERRPLTPVTHDSNVDLDDGNEVAQLRELLQRAQEQLASSTARCDRLEATVVEQEQLLSECEGIIGQLEAEVAAWEMKYDALGDTASPTKATAGRGLDGELQRRDRHAEHIDGEAEGRMKLGATPPPPGKGVGALGVSLSSTEPPSETQEGQLGSKGSRSYGSTLSITTEASDDLHAILGDESPVQAPDGQPDDADWDNMKQLVWNPFEPEGSFQEWLQSCEMVLSDVAQGPGQWCMLQDVAQFFTQWCSIVGLTEAAVCAAGGEQTGVDADDTNAALQWNMLKACFAPSPLPFAAAVHFEAVEDIAASASARLNLLQPTFPRACDVMVLPSADEDGTSTSTTMRMEEGDTVRCQYTYVGGRLQRARIS